jgi:hypothetical protein
LDFGLVIKHIGGAKDDAQLASSAGFTYDYRSLLASLPLAAALARPTCANYQASEDGCRTWSLSAVGDN